MDKDTYIMLALGGWVLLLAIGSEVASRSGWLPQWLCRKLLHLGAIGACALAPVLLTSLYTLVWIVTGVEVILLWLVATRRLLSEADGRRSWGIAIFPVAYLGLLIIYGADQDRDLIIWPMAILAVSDALAAIVGTLNARHFFSLTGDRKSWVGSATFALSAGLILCGWGVYTGVPLATAWPYLIWVAIVLAAVEAMGSGGFDNLWVPWVAALLLTDVPQPAKIAVLWLALGLGLGFAWFTVRKKALSLDGAVMAILIGIWVIRFEGPVWLVPLFFFFGSSTLIGRLVRHTDTTDAKHGKARDYWQVLCNGGVYAGMATLVGTGLFSGEPYSGIVEMAMIGSLAVSTADTWASEIGMFYRGKTWDILRKKPLPPGVSGGVSVQGSLGGAAGAGCMAALYCLVRIFRVQELFPTVDVWIMLMIFGVIVAVGVIGMQLDSLLGAGFQARYRDPATDTLSDTPAPGREQVSGFSWMTNDAVNLVSNLVVTLVFFFVLLSLVPFYMN